MIICDEYLDKNWTISKIHILIFFSFVYLNDNVKDLLYENQFYFFK